LERLLAQRRTRWERLMKNHLLELIRTGRYGGGRRLDLQEVPSMLLAPLYERAMREEWAKMPFGPDLMAMRPMNGALPTVGHQNTQKRRGKKDLCRIGGAPTNTVVWTVSTHFMRSEDKPHTAQHSEAWAVLERQWVTEIVSASPSCFVGIVRAELSSTVSKPERVVSLMAKQAFEALTPDCDEWRDPNLEIASVMADVLAKQAELDAEHGQS